MGDVAGRGEGMTDLLILWVMGVLITAFIGLLVFGLTDGQRQGARLILFCWAWPIMLPHSLIQAFRYLWKAAELPNPKRRKL